MRSNALSKSLFFDDMPANIIENPVNKPVQNKANENLCMLAVNNLFDMPVMVISVFILKIMVLTSGSHSKVFFKTVG
jgi:hypothetical protein